jgi:hypothetical protein
VAATRSALILIADTETKRVRQAGPGAVTLGEGPPEVVVACRSGQTWSCRRLPTPAGPIATESKGTVTISQQGIVLATGRWFLSAPGRLLLHITEHQPLVPSRYDLVMGQAGRRPREHTIWIDQAPDVTERRRPLASRPGRRVSRSQGAVSGRNAPVQGDGHGHLGPFRAIDLSRGRTTMTSLDRGQVGRHRTPGEISSVKVGRSSTPGAPLPTTY